MRFFRLTHSKDASAEWGAGRCALVIETWIARFCFGRDRAEWGIRSGGATARPDPCAPMIHRRAVAAGIETKLGNHSFGATGITPI